MKALDQAIEAVGRTGDLNALADHLSDDVELDMAVTVDLPPSARRIGKREVLEHLRRAACEFPHVDEGGPRQVLADGERVVVLQDERVAAVSGLTIRSECALVLDIREGSIARIGIHYELYPLMRAPARRAATARTRTKLIDDDLVASEIEA